MNNSLAHISPRTGTVSFGIGPKHGQPATVDIPCQRLARDSSANTYVYGKARAPRTLHRLSWDTRPESVVTDLLAFRQTAKGNKYLFTWTDHLGSDHTVRFSGSGLSYRQTGADTWSITIDLEEAQ